MKKITFILLAAVAVSCSPVTVSYDYDRNTNFNAYQTYSFSDDTSKPDPEANPFFKDRVMRAIENEMTERGFTKTDREPDVFVDLHVKREEYQQATASTNYPLGYWPWRFGFANGFTSSNVNYNDYVEGTLFVNIVDAENEKIVWQGRATKVLDPDLSPEKREQQVNVAIDDIFDKYPVSPEER